MIPVIVDYSIQTGYGWGVHREPQIFLLKESECNNAAIRKKLAKMNEVITDAIEIKNISFKN